LTRRIFKNSIINRKFIAKALYKRSRIMYSHLSRWEIVRRGWLVLCGAGLVLFEPGKAGAPGVARISCGAGPGAIELRYVAMRPR
jgi:hypothetical protein